MLTWKEYIKKGVVRKTLFNKGPIETLIKMADQGIETMSKIRLNEKNSSIIFKNYYDSLREICEAITLLEGYKIYSHEALALFIKKVLREEMIFQKFNRFRIIRNSIQYQGKRIPFNEAKKGMGEIIELITILKNKYLKGDNF